MSSAASLPQPADQACQQAEDALYYRRVLHELIDMGTDLARAVHKQGTAQAGSENSADGPAAMSVDEAAVAFDRISRAIRRTVALARKVAEPLPPRAVAGQDRAAARRRILRDVEDVIQRRAEGTDAEALQAELCERLDGPELEDEIGSRPVAEVVADICRDLGLAHLAGNHTWKRRTPADVAVLCARAAEQQGVGRAARPVAAQPAAPPVMVPPPSYSQEASLALMDQLLAFKPPIRGP